MENLKCKQCGLVNPFNATECKRCHASLMDGELPKDTEHADSINAEPVSGEPVTEETKEEEKKDEGVWGCIQVVILLIVAGTITGILGIYMREYLLPSGTYPMIVLIAIFIPPAIVGLAAGGLVLYLLNLVAKPFRKKD